MMFLLKKIEKNKKGTSLTSIILSLAIIGSVASVSAGEVDTILQSARDAQRKANIRQVYTALSLYYIDNFKYPVSNSDLPTVEGWENMKNKLEAKNGAFKDIYIQNLNNDPLNADIYNYKYWSDGRNFIIEYNTEQESDDSPIQLKG